MRMILSVLLLLLLAAPVLAAECDIDCPEGAVCLVNPLKVCTIGDFLNAVINLIFWTANALAPVMILIGAFNFVISMGNPQKVNRGKRIIVYTLLGYAIVLMSKGLVVVIQGILV